MRLEEEEEEEKDIIFIIKSNSIREHEWKIRNKATCLIDK